MMKISQMQKRILELRPLIRGYVAQKLVDYTEKERTVNDLLVMRSYAEFINLCSYKKFCINYDIPEKPVYSLLVKNGRQNVRVVIKSLHVDETFFKLVVNQGNRTSDVLSNHRCIKDHVVELLLNIYLDLFLDKNTYTVNRKTVTVSEKIDFATIVGLAKILDTILRPFRVKIGLNLLEKEMIIM